MDTPVRAEFIQKANLVSGSIGRKEDQRAEPIQNAKLEGDSLVFEVRPGETEGSVKFNLKVVNAGRIEGDMKGMIDVGPITGKVMLEKEK
ncbi:MAG: hypothetical protein LAQ30_15955 [Acidobacteriia bacterium]|nr:hypothetical protein [Terriglobia bacterium]